MASLEEFKNLQNLINLEIRIPEHAKMFPKDLVFKKLETFTILIGSENRYGDYMLPRTLLVREFSEVVEFDSEGTKALMTRAESLSLVGVESSVSVSEMDPKGFPELKHLSVSSSGDGIQYIVKTNYNNCIFPKLETLELPNSRKLERICDDHDHPLRVGSFENLRVINAMGCHLLNDLLSSNLARGLLRLEEIRVEWCKSMESIIVSRESENEEEIKIGFTDELRVLELKGLPRLLSFYRFKPLEGVPVPSGTPHFNKKVAFPNLEKLEIFGCDSLEKVFDVQILAMNERETCRILPFQNLREVIVFGCPALTSIFPTSLLPTLQQLERLEVGNCDKIDLFGFNNTPQLNDAIAKVISCLKCYHLESGGIIVQKNEDQRFKLKILGCGFQVSPILFALFKSFPKLDKVVVSSCSILQLFPCEPDHLAADDGGDMDTQEETFARIQHLQLRELSNMKHILSEHSPLKYHGVPRDLKVLKVVDCDSLLSLAPPSTTLFKNLTRLVVRRCRMLIKLIASSNSAKSLVNLKEMIVRECDSLEEIVVLDDQWDELSSNDKCIVFEKLEVLELQDLNSLTSFYSTANCNFRFPLLNRVIVKNCPKMKCFSKGALSTPKLIRVWDFWVKDAAEEERRQNEAKWEGDLNSTIRKFFETEYYDCVWHSRLGWESWE